MIKRAKVHAGSKPPVSSHTLCPADVPISLPRLPEAIDRRHIIFAYRVSDLAKPVGISLFPFMRVVVVLRSGCWVFCDVAENSDENAVTAGASLGQACLSPGRSKFTNMIVPGWSFSLNARFSYHDATLTTCSPLASLHHRSTAYPPSASHGSHLIQHGKYRLSSRFRPREHSVSYRTGGMPMLCRFGYQSTPPFGNTRLSDALSLDTQMTRVQHACRAAVRVSR